VSLPDRSVAADHTADPLNGMLDFTGRVAVVTGAASGIGRACALRLAEAGAHVYGADLAYKDPAEPADQHGIEPTGLDVTDPAGVEALVSRVTEEHGRLDIWVHAAGILPRAGVLDLSLAEWRRVIGATDPAEAAAGTIRKLYAKNKGENAVHGSDAEDTARFELSYFFAGCELAR